MAENNVYLIPAKTPDGTPKRIPDPIGGGLLPAEGGFRDLYNFYWQRRLDKGDVVRGSPPAERPDSRQA